MRAISHTHWEFLWNIMNCWGALTCKHCKAIFCQSSKLAPMQFAQNRPNGHTLRRIGTVAPPGHEQELPPRFSLPPPPSTSPPPSPPSPTAQLEVGAGLGCFKHFPDRTFFPPPKIELGWDIWLMRQIVTEFLFFPDNQRFPSLSLSRWQVQQIGLDS